MTQDQWQPILLICRYSTPEMIKYIIDKGVNLVCFTKNYWQPIHYLCYYSTPDMIQYIIDKVDMYCVNHSLDKIINKRFRDEKNIQYSKKDFLPFLNYSIF
jgi:hypothetical protein